MARVRNPSMISLARFAAPVASFGHGHVYGCLSNQDRPSYAELSVAALTFCYAPAAEARDVREIEAEVRDRFGE